MINYISVKKASLKWNIAERSVRDYCAKGRVRGAISYHGEWIIPEDSEKPSRLNAKQNKNYLLEKLRFYHLIIDISLLSRVLPTIKRYIKTNSRYTYVRLFGSILTSNQSIA